MCRHSHYLSRWKEVSEDYTQQDLTVFQIVKLEVLRLRASAETLVEPLELELWIGLPESQFDRVATLYPRKMDKSNLESGFYKEFNKNGTLVR